MDIQLLVLAPLLALPIMLVLAFTGCAMVRLPFHFVFVNDPTWSGVASPAEVGLIISVTTDHGTTAASNFATLYPDGRYEQTSPIHAWFGTYSGHLETNSNGVQTFEFRIDPFEEFMDRDGSLTGVESMTVMLNVARDTRCSCTVQQSFRVPYESGDTTDFRYTWMFSHDPAHVPCCQIVRL